MENLIRIIDIYGINFGFRMNNYDNFKTVLGGVLSIISLGIMCLFSYFFGQDFYYGNNPFIYFNTILPEKYDSPIILNNKNPFLAWRIENYTKSFTNSDRIIYPVTKHYRLKRNNHGVMEIIGNIVMPNSKCNNKTANVPEFNKYFNNEDWYCYDWNIGNYTFGGFFDGENADFFQTMFFLCPHGVTYIEGKNNCTDLNDYNDFDVSNGGLQISVMYPQFYFVPDDLINPLRITYKNYYYYFNLKTFKIDRFFFNKISLQDDKGWIFEDLSEKSVISFNRISMDQNFNEIKNGTSSQFYEMNFYMEKSSQVIKRSYMKIQDVSAKVGGFMKIIMTICDLISMFFSYHNFKISVFKELFEYPIINK